MSGESLYSRVPFEMGHTHFLNSIEAFPQLQSGPSFQQRQEYIRDTIKYQIMTGNAEQAKRFINLRECFKFNQRKYVEFCLAHKAPGVTLEEAAKELGYRK